MFKKTLTLFAVCVATSFAFATDDALAAGKSTHKARAKRSATVPVSKSKATAHRRMRVAVPARHANDPRGDDHAPAIGSDGNPLVRSASVLVQDQKSGEVLFAKNSDAVLPIASITKLMTAMVVLDARLNLDEQLSIGDEDVDILRGTRSRLPVGSQLTREDMLRLALMSSENRAASSLSRHYPGGHGAFIAAMNRKASSLGLRDTHFADSTGLTAANVSSARDLVLMVEAASHYPLIREFTTTAEYNVTVSGRARAYHNTNPLVKSPEWEIGVSKTGFINEAGKCLVMQAWFANKPIIIVLLDSWGRLTRVGDANRIRRWIETVALPSRQPG